MFFLYLLIEIKFIGNEGSPLFQGRDKKEEERRLGLKNHSQSSEFIESFYFLE